MERQVGAGEKWQKVLIFQSSSSSSAMLLCSLCLCVLDPPNPKHRRGLLQMMKVRALALILGLNFEVTYM